MSSRRIYITLNDQKEKDRIIEDYLSQSYSESDAIKEAIYRLATNNIQQVQKVSKDNNKMQKNTKRNKKVQKGANNTDKVEKATNDINSRQPAPINKDKVLNDTNSNSKVQTDVNDDISLDIGQFSDEPVEVKQDDKDKAEEVRQKKLKALKQFM